MPRQMDPAMLAAIQSNLILPGILFTATFQTGPVYLWSGYGSFAWNGQTWQGIGSMGDVSVIEEGTTVEARGVTVTLSGFDANLLNLVLNEFKLGAPAALYLAMFGGTIGQSSHYGTATYGQSIYAVGLLADPIPIWAGRTDQAHISVGGTTASIQLNCESRLLDMNQSVARRYTNDDQRLDYPQDRGLEFVYSIVETTINWGAKPTGTLNNR
jgi:hypothetical protein